jgi:hypothetical protein
MVRYGAGTGVEMAPDVIKIRQPSQSGITSHKCDVGALCIWRDLYLASRGDKGSSEEEVFRNRN